MAFVASKPALTVRPKRFHSYTAYSVGCAMAWAILWSIVGTRANKNTQEAVLRFFLGWVLGWTSATIARRVYPPPQRRGSP
jgi:hypothetical protein